MRLNKEHVMNRWKYWSNIPKTVTLVGTPVAILLLFLTFKVESPQWQGILSNTGVSVLTVIATVVLVDGLYRKNQKEAHAPSETFAIKNLQKILYKAIMTRHMELIPKGPESFVEIMIKDVKNPTKAKIIPKGKPDTDEDLYKEVALMRERVIKLLVEHVSSKTFSVSRAQAVSTITRTYQDISAIDELLNLRRWALATNLHQNVIDVRENLRDRSNDLSMALSATESDQNNQSSIDYVNSQYIQLVKSLTNSYFRAIDLEKDKPS